MPKKKTKKSAAKRLRFTATGKVKHAQANKGHLLTNKNRKRKRKLRGTRVLSHAESRRARAMLLS
jgi:large subunit ribosomal protein L35